MNYPEEIQVGERKFPVEYQQVFSGTSTVRIKGKKVVLKLSKFAMGRSRDEMVAKFLKWAEKRLSKVSNDFLEPVYEDGRQIVTHNKAYTLRVEIDEGRAKSRKFLDGGVITLILPEMDVEKIKKMAEQVIMDDQKGYLKEVVDELNLLHFQEHYNECRFKRMNSRFGSCSSKRNLNLAYRLLFAPREVFRYVCVHELAHLKEMNHSRRFWAHVESAMPNYKDSEKWLRENGFLLG